MSSLSTVDVVIIFAYLAVVVSLGLVMKRRAAKNLNSYFLGGRSLPWWALAMSGSSSYFDITGTMWIVSLFVVIGIKGMWLQWMWGFILPAFYMAFMGKWIRRSGVMTGSEWMETRFGSGKAGEFARGSYTLYAVLMITAFLAYGATGMGKFGSVYLPFSDHICAALIIGVTGIYVIAGGFHGVVMVEIFQTIVLSAGAIFIAYLGYSRVSPQMLASKVPAGWGSIIPHWDSAYLANTEYQLLGALLIIYVIKGLLLSLSGPEQLYDFQRFLAAKNPKDASKLGALWGAIHTVRWPMAMALAVMGIVGGYAIKTGADAEKILPMVIGGFSPGLRGLLIAALLSGFLATFNSTVNGGASYIVKDIYHKYINPSASQRKLILASYVSSAVLIALGILVSFKAESIGQMFTLIMITFGAGVLMPNVLRWYWWRINGGGYAAGATSGMALSLLQALFLKDMSVFVAFPAILITVLFITVIVSLLTEPTDGATLANFYKNVQPAGFWGPVAAEAKSAGLKLRPTAKRDFGNATIAMPWIVCMYMCPIYAVLHRWHEAAISGGIVVALSTVLFFTWYLKLGENSADEMIGESE
jgi:solute:Na+ symporter, SSS family